jgi:Divergent InlB B-repeat domain
MNNARTLILVLAAALLCSTIAARSASAARPYDDEPIGTSSDPLESHVNLQVIIVGRGSVRVSGSTCTQTCSRTFKKGDPVSLYAQDANGYQFSHWELACRYPQSRSCSVTAGYVNAVRAVFVTASPAVPVNALSATPGIGVKDGSTERKIVVVFDVGATSTVRYELRQNGVVRQSWTSSPFTGRSTRTIWIDDSIPAGTYEIGLRITTGTQVKSFHGTVVLPALG